MCNKKNTSSREGYQHQNLHPSTEKKTNTTEYKSALAEHTATTNHVIDGDGVKTQECVPDWHMRGIKEATHIRQNPNNMRRL